MKYHLSKWWDTDEDREEIEMGETNDYAEALKFLETNEFHRVYDYTKNEYSYYGNHLENWETV